VKERYNILFAAFAITFIIASIFSVYADSSNSSNLTNSTDSTNVTKEVTKSAAVQSMDSSIALSVDLTSVDLGKWPADGARHTKSSATTVTVSPNWDGHGYLYVRASDNFANKNKDTIALNNFQFKLNRAAWFYDNTDIQTFSTNNLYISYYPALKWDIYTFTYVMNYYITIPVGTAGGKYSTQVIYTIIPEE
jgi:hypothetical protein